MALLCRLHLRSSKYVKTIWNLAEQPVESAGKLAIESIAIHSSYSNAVTIVGHYYAIVIESL